MAETLLFNIPTTGPNQDIPVSINWYDSIDGFIWGQPVDSISIYSLIIDSETGKYIWRSELADAKKYHQLKTVSINGIESETGYIVPPRPENIIGSTPANIYAEKIESGSHTYSIGETIELALDIDDEDVIAYLGTSVNVIIHDIFGNTITAITANKVGDTVYAGSWKIPKSISKLYNINNVPDSDPDVYHLHDRWILVDNTYLEFDIDVAKALPIQPAEENGIISIVISDISSTDNTVMLDEEVKFTTNLKPAYCTVSDVKEIYPEFFEDIDDFKIASNIVIYSLNLDYQMRPDKITYVDRFLNACRNYVSHDVAQDYVKSGALTVSEESKDLDTFKTSKKYNFNQSILNRIKENLSQWEPVIYAGGEDTPYTTKRFIKGLFDPNRTEIGRATIDTWDNYPWVNTTTRASHYQLPDGSSVEIRGTRTVGFYTHGYSFWSRNNYVKNW